MSSLVIKLILMGLLASAAVGAYMRWEHNVAEHALLVASNARLQQRADRQDTLLRAEQDRAKRNDAEAVRLAKVAADAQRNEQEQRDEVQRLKKDPEYNQWATGRLPATEFERLCRVEREAGGGLSGACGNAASGAHNPAPAPAPTRPDERGPSAPARFLPGVGVTSERQVYWNRELDCRRSGPRGSAWRGHHRTTYHRRALTARA